ncbi:MAG TPA: TonB-dependent receptor [Terriglobales bacterium]|nr:TonB-dependent receptor [Terriglobales bacterium]
MRNFIAECLAIFLLSLVAAGQAGTGSVSGTTRDQTGAVVPNTKVTITNVNTQQARTVTSSSTGSYIVTGLLPGLYEVDATASGFNPVKQRIEVTVGSATGLDLTLGVQAAATTVEVYGEAGAAVNTENQQESSVVSSEQIAQLPTLTRNPYDLVGLSGNVQQDSQAGMGDARGAGYAINGQRSASTSILLDGGENVNLFTATVGQTVPQDSVQEYRVVTNGMTAQYGRASGGVVDLTTKSGTNDFHGSAYEFNRISALASNTYNNVANGVDKPVFTRNQFGFSVGGPIVKNKLFFFNNTEWLRVRSPAPQIDLIPDPSTLASSAPNMRAFFAQFGKLRPDLRTLGTVMGPSGLLFDKVTYNAPSDAGAGLPQNTVRTVGRVDFNITPSTSLFGRYSLSDETDEPGTVNTSPYVGFETGQTFFDQNGELSLTHTFGPTVVSTTRGIFNRLNDLQPLGAAPVGPTLYVTGVSAVRVSDAGVIGSGTQVAFPGYSAFTPGAAIPFGGPQNVAQAIEDVSWTRGNHTFRFGGQYTYVQDNRTFGAFQNAVEALASSNAALGFSNFTSGTLQSFQAAIFPQGKFPCLYNSAGVPQQNSSCAVSLPVGPPDFSRSNRYHDGAAYAQDTWKVRPRLTLNLGVRWEYYGAQKNVDPALDSNFYLGSGSNLFSQIRNGSVQLAQNSPVGGLWESHPHNFGPRVGFAYDLFGDGKTALRGGYGISYERNFGNVTFNVIQNPPNYAVMSLQGAIPVTTSNFGPLAGSSGTAFVPSTSLRAVDQTLPIAYAHQYNLSIERQISTASTFSVTYNGARGIHQYGISDINTPGNGPLFLGTPATLAPFTACKATPDLNNTTGASFSSGVCNNNFRLDPQYSSINFRSADGDLWYNGVTSQVRGRVHGQQYTISYTWSHAIDTLSSTFSDQVVNNGLGYLDPFNPKLDKGSADYDARHRISAQLLLDEPWLKTSGNWFVRNVLGGYQFAPIYTFHTGYPFSIFDCTNTIAGNNNCPRVDVAGAVPSTGTPGSDLGGNSFNYITIPALVGQYTGPTNIPGTNVALPITSSALPTCTGLLHTGCSFPANMMGRNTFRAPSVWNWDLGAYKNFKIGERVTIQARAEFFNILNHKNFYVVGFPLGGADVSSLVGPTPCPGDGTACSFAAKVQKGGYGNPFDDHRNTQLAIRVTF